MTIYSWFEKNTPKHTQQENCNKISNEKKIMNKGMWPQASVAEQTAVKSINSENHKLQGTVKSGAISPLT